MDKVRLRTRFIIMFAGILAVFLIMNLVWSLLTQQQQAEKEMREKAYVLSQQLEAVWEFMAINQDVINYDADGNYNFKGLHCSLVGKSIGKLFGKKTGYTIRYTNFDPRNKADVPDDFEVEALTLFSNDSALEELYDITDYQGKDAFRYVAPLRIDESCLECHGSPAGELDVLDYPKEGWDVGDLGGVISIVMPIDIYKGNIKSNVLGEVAYFSFVIMLLILAIYFTVTKLVTKPLEKLIEYMKKIKTGDWDIDIDSIDGAGELRDLRDYFGDMTQQLQNLYNDLEAKIQLRTEDLEKANGILESQRLQLEEANRRLQADNQYKADFLAIVSHELRTPLTSIIAFAEVMERSKMTKAEKEQRVIEEIKNNSQVLLRMINSILEMARLEAGKLELLLEPIDFVDVLNAVENLIKPIAEKKQIDFSCSIHRDVPVIDGDRERLRQIVENLVSNAIKFTPEGGKVTVSAVYDDVEHQVLLTVEDNGIGISKEDQPFIFEKFVQSDTSIYRKYNGSGLGLALAKELVELHGGWIEVSSEEGKGSLFTVGIPVGEDRGGDIE